MKHAPREESWERYLRAALTACRRAGEIERRYFRAHDLEVSHKRDSSPVTPADRAAEEAIRETLRAATPEFGLVGEEFGEEGDRRDRWIIDPLDGTKNFVAGLPYFAVLIALELDGEVFLGVVHAPLLGPGHGAIAVPAAADGALAGETWWGVRGQGAFGGTGTVRPNCEARRLRVSAVDGIERAFIAHGGLKIFHSRGYWPAFTELVARASRTRGFGDWWGHILVAEGICDAMVDPRVALHDIAAIKPIVEEAGGAVSVPARSPFVPGFHDAAITSNLLLHDALRRHFGFDAP
ncbi:MAG: histidinol phosphatase [Planctomycetes bacterium]|nr:histidinol phosphatase [Planctomycetota bacterium]